MARAVRGTASATGWKLSVERADDDRRYWPGWEIAPDLVLRRLLPAIARGPLLYVGVPGSACPSWLAEEGFGIDVLDLASVASAPIDRVRSSDREARGNWPDLLPVEPLYALTMLDGVLSFLGVREGDGLIAAVKRATRWGGVVCASVRAPDQRPDDSPDDAAQDWLAARRFVSAGELSLAFAGWSVLHLAEGRLAGVRGTHRTSVVVVRRPIHGTLLA